jgi:hypothetical protein
VPPADILRELEKLAARVGIQVRAEPFDLRVIEGRGGLCWLKGEPLVVMDAGLPVVDKIGVLAEALAAFDLEALYIPPIVRARIETRRREGRAQRQAARALLQSRRLRPSKPQSTDV